MSDLFVDNIKHQSSQGSGTITLGTSGETIALASGASVTGNGLVGITQTDTWRLTTTTNTSVNDEISSNWERSDDALFNYIGDGLTESSGVFSFPETGLYYIHYSFCIQTNTDTSALISLQATDNNSTFTDRGEVLAGAIGSGASNHTVSNANFINVTDISNIKFKFRTQSFDTGTTIIGNSAENRSGFSILRVGDSQ